MSMSNSLPPETEQLLGAANFESMAQRLSVRFSQILREWLSESEMAEVVARNAAETNPQICHSHDFADPNQAMLDAAKDLGFREIDVLDGPLSSAGIDLWNAAWNLAKSNGFEPDHVHCSDQGKGHHSDGRFNVLEQTQSGKHPLWVLRETVCFKEKLNDDIGSMEYWAWIFTSRTTDSGKGAFRWSCGVL